MNLAFVLVTSAWLAGADAADKPAAQPAAPAHPAVAAPFHNGCGSGCGSCSDSCCEEGWGKRFRNRLRGLFRKDDCCESSCDSCQAPKIKWNSGSSCGSCCDSGCDSGGLFSRLRAKFRRNDCCDSCGSSCCGSNGGTVIHGAPGAPATTAPKGESIGEPKQMPKADNKETRLIIPQPAGTLTIGQ
jgi:hypothetical protein